MTTGIPRGSADDDHATVQVSYGHHAPLAVIAPRILSIEGRAGEYDLGVVEVLASF